MYFFRSSFGRISNQSTAHGGGDVSRAAVGDNDRAVELRAARFIGVPAARVVRSCQSRSSVSWIRCRSSPSAAMRAVPAVSLSRLRR